MNAPTLLKEIEQLQAKTLQNTIDLLNEKTAWKRRALMLASKSQLCFRCGDNQGWNLATLQCGKCVKEVKETLKEVAHV